MRRERTSMSPALLASLLLHGGLVVATLVSWPWLSKSVDIGPVVPVTIVANAPVSNVRPAVQAPEVLEALTEDPAPEAPVEAVAPPDPVPDPVPTPKPAPKAAPPKPVPAPKPAPKKAESLDLDALAASIQPKKAAGQPKSSARKGPNRAETAVDARPAVGAATGLAANALASLAADLERRWNPNCEVEGGSSVDIRVAFRIASSGRVIGQPEASGEHSSDPVVKAASDRAKRAVRQAEPFENLPADLYGERIVVRFNAQKACAG